MSLAQRSKQPPPVKNGMPCSIGHILTALPDSEREALSGMLEDPAWAHEALWAALDAEGHRVGRQTVGRHRRGQCSCEAVA